MATQVATQDERPHPLVAFRTQLEKRADEFKMVLPAHITPEKFQRTVLTAIQSDVGLLDADRQSLLMSCMKAAQDGLLPDKREAALVTFKENKKVDNQWVSKILVQYMPMVYGLRKKILQSGEVTDITARAVYRREMEEGAFIYEEGTESMLRHRPLMDLTEEQAADDQIIAFYSMATYKDGSKSYEVMRRFEVDKVREKSQTGALRDRKGQPRNPSGPWVEWYSEQGKKTVMRRHSKTLPMSGDLLDVEAADDTLYANSAMRALQLAPAAEPAPMAPASLPSRTGPSALAHDPDTGEVLDDDTLAALDREGFAAMEGRGDDERGESFNEAEAPDADYDAARQIIERINGAPDGDVLGGIMAGSKSAIDALADDPKATVHAAAEHKKKLLIGGRK
jgi:recombination protein RecT